MASRVQNVHQIRSGLQLISELVRFILKCFSVVVRTIFYCFKEKPQKSVDKDIVLVTGAGHGIGKELAKQYAAEGATVVCWDINEQTNDETVREIRQLGFQKVYGYVCDVTNSKDVEESAKRVEREVGCVTILINNAGIAHIKSILAIAPNQIENTIKVNTLSQFWTIKTFLPTMQRINHGHIVSICSIAGLYGSRNGISYCASKFALRGMMEVLYQELRMIPNNKIRLSVIYPAGVNTGMFKQANTRFPSVLPIISPKEAAATIIKAQRQNLFEFSIPNYTLPIHNVMRLLPNKVQDILQDFFDIYIAE